MSEFVDGFVYINNETNEVLFTINGVKVGGVVGGEVFTSICLHLITGERMEFNNLPVSTQKLSCKLEPAVAERIFKYTESMLK